MSRLVESSQGEADPASRKLHKPQADDPIFALEPDSLDRPQ
jgi:hypothetical protein